MADEQSSSEFVSAFVTTPSMEVAKSISRALVSQKLAACVNIIPSVTSVYSWEGAVHEDSEHLLMIKTQRQRVHDLIDHVKSTHPYDVPEVIVLPIQQGNPAYLKWVADSTEKVE